MKTRISSSLETQLLNFTTLLKQCHKKEFDFTVPALLPRHEGPTSQRDELCQKEVFHTDLLIRGFTPQEQNLFPDVAGGG